MKEKVRMKRSLMKEKVSARNLSEKGGIESH